MKIVINSQIKYSVNVYSISDLQVRHALEMLQEGKEINNLQKSMIKEWCDTYLMSDKNETEIKEI